MSPARHALRLGLGRGWTEFTQSLRSAQDQGGYAVMALAVLGYLFIRRDDTVAGTDLLAPTVALPGIVGALVVFGVVMGPAYLLAMAREDGTLLRYKAVPHGLRGYFTSVLVSQSLGLLPQLLLILVPSFVLFDDVVAGAWYAGAWVLVLGVLATMPFGIVLGALVPGTQKVGGWGTLPVAGLTAISGIFFPIQQLWGWVEVVAQLFPLYWIGLGLRSAFLPDSAAALELTGSWRPVQTAAVLAAWAAVGIALAPRVLRRMARRQSGAQVEAARQAALQWVR